MFTFFKDKIKNIYSNFTQKVSSIFSRNQLDDVFIKELSTLLISADTGVKTTQKIIDILAQDIKNQRVTELAHVKERLETVLCSILEEPERSTQIPAVIMMVGVNGSGKTTFVSKLAAQLKNSGKKVLVVAGDTFRAAATHQLATWAERIGIPVFIGKENQDPASVIFDGCTKFKNEEFDHVIIDTAGRLQTKVNLMRELEKIKKIIDRQLPGYQVATWLTIDAMLGQNSIRQAEVFHEATKLDGMVLTKLDGTGKGGMVFSIVEQFKVPIMYVTFGEGLDDIKVFDPKEYVQGLFND